MAAPVSGRDLAEEVDPASVPWYDSRLMEAGPGRTLQGLPAAVGQVLALAWSASPAATSALLALQTLSAAMTGFGLLAGTGALTALLVAGPAPQRVTAALPALARVAAAYVLRGLADIGVGEAHARLTPRVRRVAEDRFYTSAAHAELTAFDDPDWYEAMGRARSRGLLYTELAVDQLVELASALVGLIAVAAVLGVLHPALLPLLAVSVAPQGWAALSSARLAYAGMFRCAALHRRQSMIGDLLTERAPAAEIRACTAQDLLLREHRQLGVTLRDEQQRIQLARTRKGMVGRALCGAGTVATLVALGLLLDAGAMPLAVAGTAVLAVRVGQAALGRIALTANKLYEHGLYIGDYQEFVTDTTARRPRVTGRSAPPAFDQIRLDRVGFRYPGSDRPALREVSMTVRRGEVIALVGENGSGKSTLAKLLAGLYDPSHGSISWDHANLAAVDASSVRERVALVCQEPTRWPMTARANITVGRHQRDDPNERALLAAARDSGAHHVISRLPLGYDTLLSRCFRGGRELSGGQWQSLAIARALYRDAPLLICDEPTASLDPRAERKAYEAIRQLAGLNPQGGRAARDRTVVLITHRLASVRDVDRICVMERGRLVEQGSHTDLLARGGCYAELYALQAANPPIPHPA